ncbi:MAG: acetolactate synthase small subunit [Rickettsiales bacterium]|jgi:acetolactate synthase-1/3 small subunit|nr:acetolactate synthase small subunit [Rickettsiales bacterium]
MTEENNRENEKSLLTVINENKPGMLSKITGYCGQNGINIEKLVISAFKSDDSLHKIIMYVSGNRNRINGLVDGFLSIDGVVSASNFMSSLYLERELMLIKVNSNDVKIPEITEIIGQFQGKTILMNRDVTIFQINDKTDIVDEITREIEKLEIENIEISKSGVLATSLSRI